MGRKLLERSLLAVLALAVLALAYGPELVREREHQTLLREGSDALATIMGIEDTGNHVNGNPQVVMTLVVHPPGRATYLAEVVLVVARAERADYRVGAELPVKFDPDQPGEVAVVGSPRFERVGSVTRRP